MRRITDMRSKKIKPPENKEDGLHKDTEERISRLNCDVLHVLERYESRLKIKSKLLKVKKVFKPSYERHLFHSEPFPFKIDIFPFINLETIIIKNSPYLELDVFSRRALKTLYLSNIPKISLSVELKIEEIYLKNIEIELEDILKLLGSPALKAIHLNKVHIYSNDKNICDRVPTENRHRSSSTILSYNELENNMVSSESAVQHMMSFTSVDDSGYRHYNIDLQSTQTNSVSYKVACQIKNNPHIKTCSFNNTNIALSPIIETRLLNHFSSFTFVSKLHYLFLSYNSSVFNFLETNVEIDCNFLDLKNLERISVENFHMLRDFNLSNIRSLEILNSSICEKMTSKILTECQQLTELSFVSCIFNNNSFFRIIDMFKESLRKINLKDSVLPYDSLDYLKTHLINCKVICRDGSVYKIR
ncbi:hypothetical protein NGRA_1055 [Nosema granulosis]|uniref:Uncharacterized protein n=1 Tax=Nosema granulosis TaxID=83296 RepID=A0A9P6H1V7_9MICR|nr:hypothetical protein NGRA_1055 [Nosema granulosis]